MHTGARPLGFERTDVPIRRAGTVTVLNAAIAAGARRVGVFGGSFDPVHEAHLHVAREAQRAFALELVVFVPAARPPHKPGRVLAGSEQRVAMLELALGARPDWCVSTLELEREGPSYTIDTVRELPRELGLAPGAQLHLVLGGDNLPGLPSWREGEALLGAVQPIVVQRGSDLEGRLAALRPSLGDELHAKLARGLLVLDPVPISSSDIRDRVARGEPIAGLVPPAVGEYIDAHDIYRGGRSR